MPEPWSDGTLWDDGTGWVNGGVPVVNELPFNLGDSQVAELFLGDPTIKRAWLGDVLLFDRSDAPLEEMVWFDGTPAEPGDQMAWFDGTPETPGVEMTWFDEAADGFAAGAAAGQATVNAVSDFDISATTVELGAVEWLAQVEEAGEPGGVVAPDFDAGSTVLNGYLWMTPLDRATHGGSGVGSIVTGPSRGNATVIDGQIRFLSDGSSTGADSLVYRVTEGEEQDDGTISFDVRSVSPFVAPGGSPYISPASNPYTGG